MKKRTDQPNQPTNLSTHQKPREYKKIPRERKKRNTYNTPSSTLQLSSSLTNQSISLSYLQSIQPSHPSRSHKDDKILVYNPITSYTANNYSQEYDDVHHVHSH